MFRSQSFPSLLSFNPLWCAVMALATAGLVRAADEVLTSVAVGAKVTLTVSASGYPAPTFQWTKAGVPIAGATGSTLALPSVTTADSGTYNAIATNDLGWALSNDLVLTVDPASAAPVITVQPPPTTTAPVGSALTLSVEAIGVPAPTYQWNKNGMAISGATSSKLTFPVLSGKDNGSYTVTVTNTVGKVTSNVSEVTVLLTAASTTEPPTITTQPISQIVEAKGSATLTVAATGSPELTYQWYKNDSPIAGATAASYTIAVMTHTQAGSYHVVVQNSAGSATSATATIALKSLAAQAASQWRPTQ